jgi:RNA polymerase sigma-70 factor (ECF subfamily)
MLTGSICETPRIPLTLAGQLRTLAARKRRPPKPLLSSVHGTVTGLFDESYLQALRDRNAEVENHLVAWFTRPVRAKLRARLRSPELVQDAFQETFLRTFLYFRAGKTLDNPASLPGFVYSTCHNVAMEFLRSHTRHDQLPDEGPGPVDRTPDPEGQMVTLERKATVRRLLDALSEKDRQLLRRVFLEEENKDSVCSEFQVDRTYLRVLLYRARQKFRAAMTHEARRSVTTVGS